MMEALQGQCIIHYRQPEDFSARKSGLFEMSQSAQRELLKRGKHELDLSPHGTGVPDVIRFGRVVSSGHSQIKEGMWVAFNKHDCDPFSYAGESYYRAQPPLAWFPELSTLVRST